MKDVQGEQDLFNDSFAHRYRKPLRQRRSSQLFQRHAKDLENEAAMSTKCAIQGETVQHSSYVLLVSRSLPLADLLEKSHFSLGVFPRVSRVRAGNFENDVVSSPTIYIS